MSDTFSYHVVQAALERCMAANPPEGAEFGLSRDASLLGDIIGEMIWRKLNEIPASVVTGKHQDALNRWLITEKETGAIQP